MIEIIDTATEKVRCETQQSGRLLEPDGDLVSPQIHCIRSSVRNIPAIANKGLSGCGRW